MFVLSLILLFRTLLFSIEDRETLYMYTCFSFEPIVLHSIECAIEWDKFIAKHYIFAIILLLLALLNYWCCCCCCYECEPMSQGRHGAHPG